MTKEQKDKLREEWKIQHQLYLEDESEYRDFEDVISDWWLAKIDTLVEETVKEILPEARGIEEVDEVSEYETGKIDGIREFRQQILDNLKCLN